MPRNNNNEPLQYSSQNIQHYNITLALENAECAHAYTVTAHPLKQEAFDQTDRLRCPVTRQLQNTAQFQTPLRDKAHK